VLYEDPALGQSAVRLTLDLHMDQDPVFGGVVTTNLRQFVDAMFAELGIPDDFLQFLIEWDGIVGPVDAGMDGDQRVAGNQGCQSKSRATLRDGSRSSLSAARTTCITGFSGPT
jgi:hypothetical protein